MGIVRKSSDGTYELHCKNTVFHGSLGPNGTIHWDNGSVWVAAGTSDDDGSLDSDANEGVTEDLTLGAKDLAEEAARFSGSAVGSVLRWSTRVVAALQSEIHLAEEPPVAVDPSESESD